MSDTLFSKIIRREIPATIVDDWREASGSLADFLDGPVTLWRLDGAAAGDPALAALLRTLPAERREAAKGPLSESPRSAAEEPR